MWPIPQARTPPNAPVNSSHVSLIQVPASRHQHTRNGCSSKEHCDTPVALMALVVHGEDEDAARKKTCLGDSQKEASDVEARLVDDEALKRRSDPKSDG